MIRKRFLRWGETMPAIDVLFLIVVFGVLPLGFGAMVYLDAMSRVRAHETRLREQAGEDAKR